MSAIKRVFLLKFLSNSKFEWGMKRGINVTLMIVTCNEKYSLLILFLKSFFFNLKSFQVNL